METGGWIDPLFDPTAAVLLLCLNKGLWDALSTSSSSDFWGFHAAGLW